VAVPGERMEGREMPEVETLLAVQQLHACCGQLVDDRRFEDLRRLFCEQVVWEATHGSGASS